MFFPPVLLLWLLAAVVPVLAQTTVTVSGTVYDPRTTGALPLPNVLVYITDTAPTAFAATLSANQVQCLTVNNLPTNIASAYSQADGTFALNYVPVTAGSTYYIVIQAGKWRFYQSIDLSQNQTGLTLHMPHNHTVGDIPYIAISTGSVDGLECVLKDMGIDQSEFTDDSGSVNPNGHIHLYSSTSTFQSGSTTLTAGGAVIGSGTPTDTVMTDHSLVMNNYDMILFPCQGSDTLYKDATALTNLLAYANAGGRVFTTHYSYAWLDPSAPYNSQFPAVANWNPGQADPAPDPGVALVNTSFTDGATLSQWLHNIGADYVDSSNTEHEGEVQINTLRLDLTSVISPTQAWLTMDSDSNAPDAIMQFTFNTPVNASAANQCGRVLFNEYHVIAASNNAGVVFPNECSASGIISPQEKMLEYALFDLSSFVQPIITPSLSIAFSPSPMAVNQGDTGDQVTIDVTNTSSSVEIDASAVLTLTLPTGMTATALSDTSGGWHCTVSTLTCTRSTSLASNASDSVTLTVNIPSYASSGLTSDTGQITATVSSTSFSNNVSNIDAVVFQKTPLIHWPTPASIYYGTSLGSTQLNATAQLNDTTVAGTYTYSPNSGEVLTPGSQALYVVFTPSDTTHYTSANGSNSIHVLYTSSSVTLTTSINPVFVSNAITFTASVKTLGVTPTGSIVLYDGNTQIGTATLSSGTASITTTALATGTHQITAAYSGDSYYPTASSNTIAQLVDDFTITLTGTSSTTLNLGQSSSFPMTISPVVGTVLPGAISMSIDGLPAETGSDLSPASLSAGVATSKVNLTVTMAKSFGYAHPLQRFGALPVALGLALLPLAGLRRLRRSAHRWLALVVLGLGLATSLTACSFQYTPKSSTVTLTATSGNLTHTTSVQVTVQ
ncbi:Ig-like domain-containing protein [Telmatobacter bradus]|uniref:Ig-like domain-containing protein n=1 Tax=Telmatobacter bradus TaxID=474953 RepID=UPI003B433E17